MPLDRQNEGIKDRWDLRARSRIIRVSLVLCDPDRLLEHIRGRPRAHLLEVTRSHPLEPTLDHTRDRLQEVTNGHPLELTRDRHPRDIIRGRLPRLIQDPRQQESLDHSQELTLASI